MNSQKSIKRPIWMIELFKSLVLEIMKEIDLFKWNSLNVEIRLKVYFL